jgi:hypothetical protein
VAIPSLIVPPIIETHFIIVYWPTLHVSKIKFSSPKTKNIEALLMNYLSKEI